MIRSDTSKEFEAKDVRIGDRLWFCNFIEYSRTFEEINGAVVTNIISDDGVEMVAIHYMEDRGRSGWLICDFTDILELSNAPS